MPFIYSAAKRSKKQGKPEFLEESLQCLAQLACAVGSDLAPILVSNKAELIDAIFNTGVSDIVFNSVTKISEYCSPCFEPIQLRVLHVVSIVLSGNPFVPLGTPSYISEEKPSFFTRIMEQMQTEPDFCKLIALRTLRTFKFSLPLSQFVDVLSSFMSCQNRLFLYFLLFFNDYLKTTKK